MSFFEEAAGFRFCQGQRDHEVAGSLVLGFQVAGYARPLVRGGKSNLIRLDFLFWLPFGNHTCFKSNLFGWLLLVALPFSLHCGGKSNLIRLDFLFWLPFSLLYLKLFQPFTLYIVTKNSQKVKYSFLIFAITFIYTSFLFHSFMV